MNIWAALSVTETIVATDTSDLSYRSFTGENNARVLKKQNGMDCSTEDFEAPECTQ